MTRPTRADAAGRAYLDLQNLARRQGHQTQTLLVTYVLERFLARLEVSEFADRLILKGGMLLAVWNARRATVDADFLARSIELNEDNVLGLVVRIAAAPAPIQDGVAFRTGTASVAAIRDGDVYGGVRVAMDATVAGAVVKLRLDISTGDPVTPPPAPVDYPTLLPTHPTLRLLAYPLPVVLAEKLCTAVELGAASTRVRDWADIWTLTRSHDVMASDLLSALAATSQHRRVGLQPLTMAIGDIAAVRGGAYIAYRRRLGPEAVKLPVEFSDVVEAVSEFADPVLRSTPLLPDRIWRAQACRWSD